eukprot:749821-Hanusia_phi.AAC.12
MKKEDGLSQLLSIGSASGLLRTEELLPTNYFVMDRFAQKYKLKKAAAGYPSSANDEHESTAVSSSNKLTIFEPTTFEIFTT